MTSLSNYLSIKGELLTKGTGHIKHFFYAFAPLALLPFTELYLAAGTFQMFSKGHLHISTNAQCHRDSLSCQRLFLAVWHSPPRLLCNPEQVTCHFHLGISASSLLVKEALE